jgi:hypothetical protein
MKTMQLSCEGGYKAKEERSTIALCLESLGFSKLAEMANNPKTKPEHIPTFLNIIKNIAKDKKRHDVIEILQFAGLIYG